MSRKKSVTAEKRDKCDYDTTKIEQLQCINKYVKQYNNQLNKEQ